MLHLEFAVAPSEIRSIEQLLRLGQLFGFHHGAVLSAFPKRWYTDVIHQFGSLSEIGNKRVTEQLQSFKDGKIVSFARAYEGNSWASAARGSHQRVPFHRLVDESFSELPVYLHSLDDLQEEDFYFQTKYPKDAVSLARAAEALLIGTEKVTLYDPFICVSKRGYRRTLLEMMSLCKKSEVEFHIFSEEVGKRDWTERLDFLRQFTQELPENIRLFWYCANDNESGFLHQRGLFTSKGGLIYDRGFQEPGNIDQRAVMMDITPMPVVMLQDKLRSYNASQQSEDFTLVRDVWCSHP